MVNSRINSEINYETCKSILKSDFGKQSPLFEIPYNDDSYITITLGGVQKDNINRGILYTPIYLKKYTNSLPVQQCTRIGVYEFRASDYASVLDEDNDINPDNLSLPLYFPFVNEAFLKGGGN